MLELGARLSAGRRDGYWQQCGPAVFRSRVDRLLLKLCFIENYNRIMYIIKGLFIYMYSVVSLQENG